MPRSGYDSTNCPNLEDARRNHQATQASTDTLGVGPQATSIPTSLTPPVSDPNPSSPSPSLPSPIVPEPRSVRLSSSTLSSTAAPSTIYPVATSIVPFLSRPTPIPSPASLTSTPTNPTRLSPSSTITRVEVDRTLLPTVRISPGYVENTGGYRVYNGSTGRGWRYSPPSVGSVSPVPSRGQHEPDATISGHGRLRRQRQTGPQPRPGARRSRRRPVQSAVRREPCPLSHTHSIDHSPAAVNPTARDNMPQPSTADSPRLEGGLNNGEQLNRQNPSKSDVSATPAATNVDNSTEEGGKQEDEQGNGKLAAAGTPYFPGPVTKPSPSCSS